jgi:hypothetical protein
MGVYYKKHLILAPCTFTLYTRVFPSAVHGCNLLVLDMVMLKPKLALAPPAFTLNTHECSEVLLVLFGRIGYCASQPIIWHLAQPAYTLNTHEY